MHSEIRIYRRINMGVRQEKGNDAQFPLTTLVLALICSEGKVKGICKLLFILDSNAYDSACMLKSNLSGRRVQIYRGCYKRTTQSIPFSGLYSANSGSREQTEKEEWVIQYAKMSNLNYLKDAKTQRKLISDIRKRHSFWPHNEKITT